MRRITLQYPRLWRYWPRTIHTTHPDKWEELTPDQMVAVGKLMTDSITDSQCLSVMLGVRKRVVKRLDAYQRYHLGCLLEFLRQQTPHNRFIISNIGLFYAPADNLSDLTFEEFMLADTFFADYIETGNIRNLAVMVACLYRQKPPGHKRMPFDEDMAEAWADELQQHDRAVLEAVGVNYGLVRKWLQKAYPAVFPEAPEPDPNAPAPTQKKNNKGGWLEVFDALVGDDGVNEDRYKQMRAMNVLRRMNNKIKENRKRKR